jgi:hypothetical protein
MSILSDLQTKKLGLFELMAMGCDLYVNHFQSFFVLICMSLPFSIIINFLSSNLDLNPPFLILLSIFYGFYFSIFIPAYTMAVSMFIEGYVLGDSPRLSIILRKVLSRLLPLFSLNTRYLISSFLRSLFFLVPGIIYSVNNGFCIFAFVLRDQRGKAAFQYSRSLIKGNWWKVFFFTTLILIIVFATQILTIKILSSIITNSPVFVGIVSDILTNLVMGGIGISGVLLFLNLDFQKR